MKNHEEEIHKIVFLSEIKDIWEHNVKTLEAIKLYHAQTICLDKRLEAVEAKSKRLMLAILSMGLFIFGMFLHKVF